MPTKMPARNYWQIPFLEGNWWDFPSSTAHNTFEMVIAGLGNPNIGSGEYGRCAMKFDTTAPPAWVSDGDAVEINCLLFVFLGSDSSDQSDGIQIAQVTAGLWDENSNYAAMTGLTLGGFTGSIFPLPTATLDGWVVFPIPNLSAWMRNALGLVFKVDVSGTGLDSQKILKEPAPYVRAYYQYPLDNVIETDATQRLTLSDSIIAHTGVPNSKYSISASINQSDTFPTKADVPVILSKQSSLAVLTRELTMPMTWKPKFSGRGSVTVSRSPDIREHSGKLLNIELTQRNEQKPADVIGSSAVILGEIQLDDSGQSTTLEDPVAETIGRSTYYRDILEAYSGTNIDDEPAIWAMVSMFVNGTGTPWGRFRQEDLVWLFRRFGLVWSHVTVSTIDMQGYTIRGLIEEYGELYGICIGRGSDDAITFFHPAAYRPSMHVWDFDLDDDRVRGVRLIERKANKKFNNVTVNDYLTPFPIERSTRYDRIDSNHSVAGLVGDFSHDCAKAGLGTQLALRLCSRVSDLTFEAGAITLLWEDGDQIRITSSRYNLDATPFMVTSVCETPIKGRGRVKLVHYHDTPSLHNTFLDTKLEGLWRWRDWYPDTGDASNQAWEGSGGTWTGGMSSFNRKWIDWQSCIGEVDAHILSSSGFAPTDTTDTCDLVDFVLGVNGDQDTDPYTLSKDNEYNQILCFRKASGNHAVIVGIHRVDEDVNPGIQCHAVDNSIFLGYTLDYLATTTTWVTYTETSRGLSVGGVGWLTYGVAMQWLNGTAYLWVNRHYIGSIAVSKTDFDRAYFTTEVVAEHAVGMTRWLKRTDGQQFEAERLLGKNGTDPLYP